MTEYDKKRQQLQKEFIDIKKKAKWKFEPHQQAIFDFVIKNQKNTTFKVKDYTITIKRGNKDFGFMHILLRHYGKGCDGEITALDILKMGNVIKCDTSVPSQKENRKNFIQSKNDNKYTVVLEEKNPNDLVFTFFSSK